jgi:isopentenyl-diphosphate Delta-isomerase
VWNKGENMNETFVILVDEKDNPLGLMEKLEAHRKGLLHRAISVFIFNSRGEWILQKRAHDKYHSKGLWTNTCCTHPLPEESAIEAAGRRLTEEMGLTCSLQKLFSFTYKEMLDNDLTEYEYDHVFIGVTDTEPVINTSEVVAWKKMSYDELHNDIISNPDNYTFWFKEIHKRVNSHLISQKFTRDDNI